MDKYHFGIDPTKSDDLACLVIRKGATLLAEFYGPRCEEQALQWALTRMDATDADLAAAQRELDVWQEAMRECGISLLDFVRVQKMARKMLREQKSAELLAQEGVPAQPQYREPTIEDAWQLKSIQAFSALEMQYALKQLNFVRKVQP